MDDGRPQFQEKPLCGIFALSIHAHGDNRSAVNPSDGESLEPDFQGDACVKTAEDFACHQVREIF